MEPHEFIEGHAQIVEAFGQWPNFHDAEVHRVVLDRTRKSPSGSYYPSVELVIRGWVMTSEVTQGGYFKLEHDSLVHFLFEHVSEVELDGLNHQNVLFSLELELSNEAESELPALFVELSHCFGLSGSFETRQARILSVEPYTES